MASLRLTSRNLTSMVTWARGAVRSSNMRRAGMTLETRSRRITLLFWVSKATFSMAKACCTAVTMALKSCGLVASAHRGAAFDAFLWMIDTLKKTVPIWKKETFVDGVVWADGEPFPAGLAVDPEASHEG